VGLFHKEITMKVLVETTSNIMLLDPNTGDVIDDAVPTLTVWTAFLEARAGLGQVRLLHRGFREEATNEAWLDCLKQSGNLELAIPAFVSEFGIQEAPGTKKPAVTVEQKVDEIAPSKPVRKKG
jgi:hypothetical protein